MKGNSSNNNSDIFIGREVVRLYIHYTYTMSAGVCICSISSGRNQNSFVTNFPSTAQEKLPHFCTWRIVVARQDWPGPGGSLLEIRKGHKAIKSD